MEEVCSDNRFEIIKAAKDTLCDETNIEDSPTEWAVIDSILFRMWQMGWLPGQESTCKNIDKDNGFTCSVCGCSIPEDYLSYFSRMGMFVFLLHYPHHCPDCGAKVVE